MQPLLEKGKLPHIKQLIDSGSYGTMRSSYPLKSEVVWTSIATGKTFEKHGISDRLLIDPVSGEYLPPTSNLRKSKAIWNILSENKKTVGIVNYMVTWPPEHVKGVMIAGRKTDVNDINFLSKDLSSPSFDKLCSRKEFEGFKVLNASPFRGLKNEEGGLHCYNTQGIDNFMANFSNYLLKTQSFDFFCLYLRGIDVTSHAFWKYSFPGTFTVTAQEIKKKQDLIYDYYLWCDRKIGELLEAANKFDLVILCSDHGFQSRPEPLFIFNKVDYLLELCGLSKFEKNGKETILKNEPADRVSFKKNIKIQGDLSAEEFDAVRQLAKQVLSQLTVKETQDRFFESFQDTQSGFLAKVAEPYKKPNPGDHLVIGQKEYMISDIISENLYSGDHSQSAVIIMSGRNIRRHTKINAATIYDIMPTILYYMGFAQAKDIDGKILSEAIEEDFLRRNPPRYIASYEREAKEGKIQMPIRSGDERKIKDMMRSLGYIN